jgi:hypothetical protein
MVGKLTEANKKSPTDYRCESCNITFKHSSSYCRHKKTCLEMNIQSKINENISRNVIIEKENLLVK